jgi:tetratricopeptide (TPR) repeat protein
MSAMHASGMQRMSDSRQWLAQGDQDTSQPTKHEANRQSARTGPDRLLFLQRQKEFDRLVEICSQKLQKHPYNDKALLVRASAYLKSGTIAALTLTLCCSLLRGAVAENDCTPPLPETCVLCYPPCPALSHPSRTLCKAFPFTFQSFTDKLTAALKDYETVIQLKPQDTDALYYKGATLERMGKVDEAIDAFTQVLDQDPNHIKAAYARGACQNLKGFFAEAICAFLHSCFLY